MGSWLKEPATWDAAVQGELPGEGAGRGLKTRSGRRLIRLFNPKSELKQDMLVASTFISLLQKEGSYLLSVQPVWAQSHPVTVVLDCWEASHTEAAVVLLSRQGNTLKESQGISLGILGLGRTWQGCFCKRELL